MKKINLKILVGIITFIIGISVASFWYLNLNNQQVQSNSIFTKVDDRSSVNNSAWQTFISFENQDLKKLDWKQKDELQKAIDALVGNSTDTGDLILISKISNEKGELNYMLLGEKPLLIIPGDSGLRIQLFNLEGTLINSLSFASGWRIGLKDIKVNYSNKIKREVIEVSSEPVINGRDVAKQFYALVGKEILLIRLEDSKGQIIRNVYGAPNYVIGLNKKGFSVDEWERMLETNDIAELLATLSWLNGVHWNPAKQQTENWFEDINEATLAEKVRSREGVKEKIKKLAQSKNNWIKDSIQLAQKVEYNR